MNSLMWFRRDIRIHDNPALREAIELGATKAIYISTPRQWCKHNVSPIQVDLVRRHLIMLDKQLAEIGIRLEHLEASDYQDQVALLAGYCRENKVHKVCANEEIEVNEQKRDAAFSSLGFELSLHRDTTILPLGSVLNKQGQMFKVFTPFKKAWLNRLQSTGVECLATPRSISNRSDREAISLTRLSDEEVQRKYHLNYPLQDSSKWPLSDHIMQTSVATFLEGRLEYYAEERDFPALKASSLLSPYLSTGVMSVRWLATQLLQKKPDIIYDDSVEGFSWLNELIWREFYKNLLYHCPELAKGRCFQAKYQTLSWPNNRRYYKAWCEGKTGYPLVDAAMKQLVQTGWMHNRLRMVVASFLTKHLLVDWRWGERFFMSHLIDGDLSANNGGWQWAASTGCDAQPYFRVFNPLTQSKKFDPSGEFIRTYLPELKDVPDKYVHFPHQYLASNRNLSLFEGDRAEYPKPIVEHKAARLAALAFFK